jgi:hypothetical protein
VRVSACLHTASTDCACIACIHLLSVLRNAVLLCTQTLDSVVSAAAVRAKKVAHSCSSSSSSGTATSTDATSESTPFTQERAALQAQLLAARQSKHDLQQTVTRLETEVIQPLTLPVFKMI